MFCTKCGKELYEDDKFCAFCGAEVRPHQATKNEEVVFNPLFKIEAQKKTEEILKAAEEIKEKENSPVKRETISFNWNLDGFPERTPKKTEAADFNWDSVLEKRTARKYDDEISFAEKLEPTYEMQAEGYGDEHLTELEDDALEAFDSFDTAESEKGLQNEDILDIPSKDEDFLYYEKLQKELFGEGAVDAKVGGNEGDKNKNKDKERFYTFNKKQDEFEELLNKERERVRIMEDEYNKRFEKTDFVPPAETFALRDDEAGGSESLESELSKTKEFAHININTQNTEEERKEPSPVAVVQPQTPRSVDMTIISPENTPADTPEQEKESPEDASHSSAEKGKLRFSDVFPAIDAASETAPTPENKAELALGAAENSSGDDDEEQSKKPGKGRRLISILLIALLVLLLFEAILLTIKLAAPDSNAAQMIEDTMVKVGQLISGDGEARQASTEYNPKDSYISDLVANAAKNADYIGTVFYNSDLSYAEDTSLLAFPETATADEFVDADWEEAGATYGEKLTESLVRYYDAWQGSNSDTNILGINTLEIGEIKTGENGFYVLCRLAYAKADGTELSKLQTVFVKLSNGLMVINEIKEERF